MKQTGIKVTGVAFKKGKTRQVLEMKPVYRNKSHAIAAKKSKKQKWKAVK